MINPSFRKKSNTNNLTSCCYGVACITSDNPIAFDIYNISLYTFCVNMFSDINFIHKKDILLFIDIKIEYAFIGKGCQVKKLNRPGS